MGRNDSIFAMNITGPNIQRSKFDRNSQHKTSLNAGELVPIYVDEVLPGDTKIIDTSTVVRMGTPIAPVMDNAFLDIYFFFVPSRIVWEHWKQFMGEADTMAWTQTGTYVVPKATLAFTGSAVPATYIGTIGDHMGIPLVQMADVCKTGNKSYTWYANELPLRAYTMIWNEWFRDQTTQPNVLFSKGDTASSAIQYTYSCLKVNKFKDYFTACLPAPQKGSSVSLPLGTDAPVKTGAVTMNNASTNALVWRGTGTQTMASGALFGTLAGTSPNQYYTTGRSTSYTTTGNAGSLYPANLYADLSNATAATINSLRLAFALQKLLERDARGGTRYREMLKAHFGVTSPDARFQIPEYLGGKRTPINMDQVCQTSGALSQTGKNDSALGDTGAYSWTSDRGHSCSFSATEHGYIIGVACIRTDHTYSQGLDRIWTRSERFDFYFPAFANIGEQAVYKSEICVDASNENSVFGYQEAWAEYRYKKNLVSGYMNPVAPNSLDYWTYADDFGTSSPALNSSFKQETVVNIDRTLNAPSQTGGTSNNVPQFVADFYFKEVAIRPMPMYSIPGLLDHN